MGTLYIKEYKLIGKDDAHSVQIPQEPGTDQTPVTTSGTAAQSAVLADTTRIVMLESSTDCHILFGENPTATTNHEPLKAGVTKYKGVDKNSGLKVSVIEA